jgi:hypothetical protein
MTSTTDHSQTCSHASAPELQINFAGEGGLYAEMIQDRSFDAMALALGFPPANATVPLRPPSNSAAAAAAAGRRHGRRSSWDAAHDRPSVHSGAIAGMASLFSMPMPMAKGEAAANAASRVGSGGALELQLYASAFGEVSYGGKPRLPRPPAYGPARAGFHGPGR